jgi:hypothetical protein
VFLEESDVVLRLPEVLLVPVVLLVPDVPAFLVEPVLDVVLLMPVVFLAFDV